MDINGAKALKKRLGAKAPKDETPPARADVHKDAPPVYHWTGVRPDSAAADSDDPPADRSVSKFFRLGLSFR